MAQYHSVSGGSDRNRIQISLIPTQWTSCTSLNIITFIFGEQKLTLSKKKKGTGTVPSLGLVLGPSVPQLRVSEDSFILHIVISLHFCIVCSVIHGGKNPNQLIFSSELQPEHYAELSISELKQIQLQWPCHRHTLLTAKNSICSSFCSGMTVLWPKCSSLPHVGEFSFWEQICLVPPPTSAYLSGFHLLFPPSLCG